MSRFQKTVTCHTKNQEVRRLSDKRQWMPSIEMTEVLALSDQGFKTAMIKKCFSEQLGTYLKLIKKLQVPAKKQKI